MDQFLNRPLQLALDPPVCLHAHRPECGHSATEAPAGPTPAAPTLVFGTLSQLMNIAALLVVAAPLCLTIADWLRASMIGCVWGALAFAGLMTSWSQRRLFSGIYALLLAQLAQQSLRTLAELDHHAAWAVAVVVLGGGWCVGLLWTPWNAHGRQAVCISTASLAGRRLTRWSLWDIACLATGVAILSWVAPRIETSLQLICQIAPALVGGLFASLVAVEWACRDQWSLRRMLGVVVGGPAACVLCLWLATATTGLQAQGWQAVFSWWLAGPGSVMAAQGLTVLAYLAAARGDTQWAAAPAPASPRAARCRTVAGSEP